MSTKLKLLNQFKKKYGEPESVTNYFHSSKMRFNFEHPDFNKSRWVCIDETGEIAFNGKQTFSNIYKRGNK